MARKVNGVVVSKHPKFILGEVEDIKGQQFGHLTVIEFDHKDNQGRAMWKCQCDCGKTCVVRANHLKDGSVISCGHVNREKTGEHLKSLNLTHGASNEPWYSNYISMIRRATNPNENDAKYYNHDKINGALIEPEWLNDPWSFYREIGNKPSQNYSIDRINPDLGYVKGNVRWANKSMQALNRHVKNGAKNKYKGIHLWPKGQNRRAHDRYTAYGTINGKRSILGNFYILSNALRCRYDFESKYNIYHTFERPAGDYELEPNYNLSKHPGVFLDKKRKVYRVSLPFGHHKSKFIGSYKTLTEAQAAYTKAKQQYENGESITVDHQQRHNEGIIGIDPDGNKHYYKSITDAKAQLNTNANLSRHLKDSKPFSRRRSKLYGWRFEYAK